MKKPTKAIIAAAGFGTRFLPQTKAMPKEMLPLIDKPIIQYVVEELVEAGIKDIIIIGSANKRAIEDHFDTPNEELLANLRAGGAKKQPLIDVVQRLSEMANFVYIRQKGPYGNATPLTCASHLIMPGESVIYTFADDFIEASPSRFRQMIEASQQLDGAILSCKKIVEDAEFDRYGVEITNGTYYDTGDKLEYIKTVVDFGLKHQKLGPALRRFLQSRINGENR